MRKKCAFCDGLGIFTVTTNYYVQKHEDGRHVASIKKSSHDVVCGRHLLPEVLLKHRSAHHMVWRTYDRYTPDGINYERLLRETVECLADYHGQTVAQFMGMPWPDELIRAFVSTPSGPYWEPLLTARDHLRGLWNLAIGWIRSLLRGG